MNTNSNTYTLIYTAIVVVIVAAVLSFVSQKLGPMQAANEKAETVSQILTAAQFGEKESWSAKGNAAVLEFYKENIQAAYLVNASGDKIDSLDIEKLEIYSVSDLKAQNYKIRDVADFALPVYQFKNGICVVPIYGAGLWGPVWGYIAVNGDCMTIVGAYFDHESETPGLGGKIKDDPAFRAQFAGKRIFWYEPVNFAIVKGGTKGAKNYVDAITGATMTSKGLNAAISQWLSAYKVFFCKKMDEIQIGNAVVEEEE